jgi:Acyl-CoA thioesterase N-terminal domain/Acyl-CoA thioesterase C-terminal domain
MAIPESVFLPDGVGAEGERFIATELARGPWDPNAQHGGAPSALLARAIERHEPGPATHVARLTIELLRPVPLGPLEVRTRTLRPGKKVQLVEAALVVDGAEVARAVGLRMREKPLDLPGATSASDRLEQGPDAANRFVFERVGPISFGGAMEIAAVRGSIEQVGRATVWFRLTVPLVAGEETSPLMRVGAAADFGNGVSSVVDWNAGWMFINPDLTIYLNRYPTTEWVAIDAVTYPSDRGVGFAEAGLYDENGRIGRSVQSLLFDRLDL